MTITDSIISNERCDSNHSTSYDIDYSWSGSNLVNEKVENYGFTFLPNYIKIVSTISHMYIEVSQMGNYDMFNFPSPSKTLSAQRHLYSTEYQFDIERL